MSQPPVDPPPMPVVPMPQQPDYANLGGSDAGRPGVVTFIGVLSITLGSLAILAGLLTLLLDSALLRLASAMKTIGSTSHVYTAGIAGTATAERLPFNGLPAADRRNITAGLSQVRDLSPRQQLQLDEMLAESGKTIFNGTQNLPPAALARTVSSSGHRQSNTVDALDYFVLGSGRLEVSEDRAAFFPSEPQPPIRANAIEIPLSVYPSTSPARALTTDQIRSVIRTIKEIDTRGVTAAQLAAVATTLQNPVQQIVVPTTDGTDPAWEITSAYTMPDGTLTFTAAHGSTSAMLSLNSAGNMTQSSASTTGSITTFGGPTINPHAGSAALLLSVVQLGLAIFLLIAGVLTLRNSPSARRLHWIYVGLKIPLAVLTAAASAWMWHSLMMSLPTVGKSGRPLFVAAFYMGGLPVAVASIYPIALIFILRSRAANQFYDPVTSAGR